MAKQYDVIVVGAGMVGALAGILLAQSSLRVAIIDKNDGYYPLSTPPSYDARVSAISSQSKALLESSGAWQRIDQHRLAAYNNMVVWDGLGQGYIDFNAQKAAMPELGHLVENNVLCDALIAQAKQESNIDLYFSETLESHELSDAGVKVALASGLPLEAQTLIAADGALSLLRTQNAFDTVEWDYGHHAIVATLEIDRSHENTAWQCFGEEGILAFLPLPDVDDRHFVSIVWSVPPKESDVLMALDNNTFATRLHYAIGKRFKVLGLTTKRYAIPLRQRHAKQYVKSGIALIGDAAHTIHPLAGQGANLGFGDVKALVAVLTKAHKRGEHLGQSRVLRRFQRERMLDNIAMAAGMESFKRLFASQNPIIVQLRNMGMTGFHNSPALKQRLVARAAGLSSFS